MTIKVNRQEWDKLEADQQKAVGDIIGQHFQGETVEPADGPDAVAQLGGACEIACDIAQAAAIEACKKLPFGSGICITLAKEAGNLCRSKC